jgi:hypothetical protein
MRERKRHLAALVCLGFIFLVFELVAPPEILAAEPPYEFSAELSLTGGCSTSKADPIPDPGCPERKPPKPFTKPQGIAIDSFGDEYVASYGGEEGKQGRIDVFSPEGVYVAEVEDAFGPKDVAVDGKGVLYTFDQSPGHNAEFARYKPTVYKPEEEEFEYGPRELIEERLGPHEGGLAIDSNDHVLVDWSSSINEYNSAAEGNELKGTFTNPKLQSSTFIALDKQRRRLYTSSCPTGKIDECWVLVFDADAPHELLKEVKGPEGPESKEIFASHKGWISVAVDEESGDFFVGDLELSKNVYQFNEEYELVSTLEQSPELFEGGEPLQIAVSNAPEGTENRHYLFVPSLKGNRALAYSPPKELGPPIVESLAVTGIGEEEAEVQARVKPDGTTTTYRFEYLSEEEWEEAGESFAGAKVAGEGTISSSQQEAEVKAVLSGLQPGTAYRFRIFAENEFEEGVIGEDEEEGTFTTYTDAPITTECPKAIRSTYSTLLPDCRAYELVTPPNTNGRPPRGVGFTGDRFPTLESSPTGNAVSFLTEGGVIPGLGGTGSFNGDLYRTTRTESGWSTESAGPNGEETTSVNEGSTSPDQGYSFWRATREGSAVVEGAATNYVRYPDGHSALIGRGSKGTDPRAEGKLITENGTHIIFETQAFNGEQPIQLEPDAPPTGIGAVYDRTPDEVTHVVSLLPGNETPKAGAKYVGASADGEGIAFSIGNVLYMRVANTTTYEIGTGVEFAGVSEGGSRIFFVEGGDLFAFDTSSEEAIQFTEVGNVVPVNVPPGGTRAYFVSTTAIPGSGENPNGALVQAGQQNLYLSEEGAIRFVATVTERDVVGEKRADGAFDGLGLWSLALQFHRPAIDPARTNPDGSILLFQSRANLAGYDSQGAPELYRYDRAGNRLHCISCIPTKTPATNGASLQSVAPIQVSPEPFSGFGFVQNLRADGKRVIFQSTEALVSRDNDGVQDVYEWEEGGQGSCTRSGGCVYLISSGHSSSENYLYGISASGNDVFFTTSDILAGSDDNTQSIYDARVEGGFPEPVEEPCKGEGCRPVLSPPPPIVHSESGVRPESGNVKPCPKGKHKANRNGKQVCVKNKKHHKKHHAKKKGRAGK